MPDDTFHDQILSLLSAAASKGRLRRRTVVEPLDAAHVRADDQILINFCSNNYLGLTHHPHVIEAAAAATRAFGAGAGAAALISGYSTLHAKAEAEIARWKNAGGAVLMPSGYQANVAAVQTLFAIARAAGRSARFLLDKLCHASLLDAVAATGADMRVFPHNGIAKLQRLLEEAPPDQNQVIVTESIFSMDGDAPDLEKIATLRDRYQAVLLLDEAHASGVYGECGAGLASELHLSDKVDVSIVTLSKGLGGIGAAVCASAAFCEALVNVGRAAIFTTNVPPACAATAIAAIQVLHDEPQRIQRVRMLARRLRERLRNAGIAIAQGDSPIIPIVLGEESAALAAAAEFRKKGLLVQAIRPPTVPPGSSRLRVTLSSAHSDQELDRLATELIRIGEKRSATDKHR